MKTIEQKRKEAIEYLGSKWVLHKDNAPKRIPVIKGVLK